MYMNKLKIKTSSVNAWRSLCWWPDLSDCLVTSSISQGWPQKKPADHNCWDDGEARREDPGWQSKNIVWRRHWRQTGRGQWGTGVLGCADRQTSKLLTEVDTDEGDYVTVSQDFSKQSYQQQLTVSTCHGRISLASTT